jgi:hypothetical protein
VLEKQYSYMQKLSRRFTQCGNIMFATVFIVIFSFGGTALTTFGINKPDDELVPIITRKSPTLPVVLIVLANL